VTTPSDREQTLFEAHFERGRRHYEQRQLPEAERELEEAYLLRPREPHVLNLLGIVYFRLGRLEQAEEVYSKLASESPETPTLHFNLGLICLKLERFEEAETAFLKALELAGSQPKIHFYLGSLYERQQRFQDAIWQYRQAGARKRVTRVESRAAGTTPAPFGPPPRRRDDTARFRAEELAAALRLRGDGTSTVPPMGAPVPKVVEPPSPSLFSGGTLPPPAVTDTQRFASGTSTVPPEGPVPADRLLSLGAAAGEPAPDTLRGFRFVRRNLLEIEFAGKLFIKQGTIYSYSGNLTFWVKERRSGGQPALVILTGSGRVLLTDKEHEIALLPVSGEPVFVEPAHLLACEEGLGPRYGTIGAGGPEYLVLEGEGLAAISLQSRPLGLTVTPELPVSLPFDSVVSWSAGLTPHRVEDAQLREVLLPADGRTRELIRLEGSGRVLVEQGGE
jgi:uncharacterized protein (AIM24 family)